jgi:hypothetical protein
VWEFTVRTGTILERSHVPLAKWVLAMDRVFRSEDDVVPARLAAELGFTPKTAALVLRRLRQAWPADAGSLEQIVDAVLAFRPPNKSLAAKRKRRRAVRRAAAVAKK